MVRFPRGVLAVCPMSHPLWRWPLVRMRHRVGNVLKDQDYCESIGASPRNSVECGGFNYICGALVVQIGCKYLREGTYFLRSARKAGCRQVVVCPMPKRGLEPPRGDPHMTLNHARLPIPPLRQMWEKI